MSDQYCNICKKKLARICITGRGNYCLDCHNAQMLEKFGREDTFEYAENVSVVEPSGTVHTFNIEHLILGGDVFWDAFEQNGHYHFRERSTVDENGGAAEDRFFRKIADGVCTKTLQKSEVPSSNLLYRDGKCFSIKEKGTLNIVEDNCGNGVMFEIDGQKFKPEDLKELLGGYQGFSLQYQIRDMTAPVLKEDEYLVPTWITKESLCSELSEAVNIYGDRGFISYGAIVEFDQAAEPVLAKLETLAKYGDRTNALEAGKEMARIFLDIETDDDYFPEYHLQNIGSIVDPYGQDEELKQLIGSYYER